ncbi:uncharacterized protein E0L32_006724 [Thyridium curvatum]|uniref:Uncharacterized protein n=1 Tax=Thyridium curvatum TaxID=1093900 RepID=A0A507B2A5_9PEZI|nr:uncharacterized protein E0L32_006724 [Thyridium curvatum]TPX12844.1 hypothetical protein E0L32_006724 [Thyridium curvatum]
MALYMESDLEETLSLMEEVSLDQPSRPTLSTHPVAFRNLPPELRDQIYKEVLIHKEPIIVEKGDTQRQPVTVGLLRANKTIHAEASPILYGQNWFDLTDMEADPIIRFFRQIGRRNAAYLRKMLIDFLDIDITGPLEFTIIDGSVRVMAAIQHHCVNLVSLTVSLLNWQGMDKIDVRPYILCGAWLFESALKLLANQMRTIPTLRTMKAVVYDRHLEHVERILARHGFLLSTIRWPRGMHRNIADDAQPFRTARQISWHEDLVFPQFP